MNLKTIFNLEDEVYFMKENRIHKDKVKEIKLEISKGWGDNGEPSIDEKYILSNAAEEYDVCDLFSKKETLISVISESVITPK